MDFKATKPTVTAFNVKYVDGTDTGIILNLRHSSDDVMKAIGKNFTSEQLALSDKGAGQEAFSELLIDQSARKRFYAIESWDWTGEATYGGKKPELTLADVTEICGNLDWFRAEIDRHLGNEKAFHPKLQSGSKKQ